MELNTRLQNRLAESIHKSTPTSKQINTLKTDKKRTVQIILGEKTNQATPISTPFKGKTLRSGLKTGIKGTIKTVPKSTVRPKTDKKTQSTRKLKVFQDKPKVRIEDEVPELEYCPPSVEHCNFC